MPPFSFKHHRQSPGMCGPASLKILLSHYGKDFTEEELAGLCGSTAEHGTGHAGHIKAIKALGGEPIVKYDASIEDIRHYVERQVPVIVNWWSEDDGHYSVVYDIDERHIYLMDPELDEGMRKIPLEEFDKIWYDYTVPDDVHVKHWMMAVPPFGS